MKYHINTRGEIKPCTATVRCPFGDLEKDHYTSMESARKVFEIIMNSSFDYSGRSLKSLTSIELKKAILDEIHILVNKEKLSDVIDFATILHEGQFRSDLTQGRNKSPYIEHPLRNTLRLIRMGIKDDSVLQASVLHDTIEDTAIKYSTEFTSIENPNEMISRITLAHKIENSWGAITLSLVENVTNPYDFRAKEKTHDEKNIEYLDHIKKCLSKNPETYLVKYVDFIDNAGSLHWSTSSGSRIKSLAKKYYPVVKEFEYALETHDFSRHINNDKISQIKSKLEKIDARLKEILQK